MAALQRWPAFSLSLVLHAGVIAFVLWLDIALAPPSQPHYNVLVIPPKTPQDAKIIWYNTRKALPEIAPDHSFGPSVTPRGEKDPTRTIVTVAPDASSSRQLIRQPDQPKLLLTDVPAPNMVALQVKLPPKAFVPPPLFKPPPKAAIAAVEAQRIVEAPKTESVNSLGALTALQKLPPKAFVPPAAQASGKQAPHMDAPSVPAMDAQSIQPTGLQAVMVGLNPASALPPPGSRPGQIARAPEAGAPSSGTSAPTSAAIVPGVLSKGSSGELSAPNPLPSASIPTRQLPREIVLPPLNRTMSAPLRPSARLIPAAVEARFSHQNVYTLVIPGPAVPGYSGDWVMWFAEHDPAEASAGTRISAPIPARKFSAINVEPGTSGIQAAGTFQFSAAIDKAGHIGSLVVLRGPVDPVLRRLALGELASWEFKPALRNGVSIDADVVLEISFRFQTPMEASH